MLIFRAESNKTNFKLQKIIYMGQVDVFIKDQYKFIM